MRNVMTPKASWLYSTIPPFYAPIPKFVPSPSTREMPNSTPNANVPSKKNTSILFCASSSLLLVRWDFQRNFAVRTPPLSSREL